MINKTFIHFLYKQYYNAKVKVEKLRLQRKETNPPQLLDDKLNSAIVLYAAFSELIDKYIDTHNGDS
jgi:hypothetical protein